MNKFIFDVDGTLTPSRGVIDLEFKAFFNMFCLSNDVYLVTGSDKAKTVEQISEHTYNLCKRVYNCSGNDVWQGNNHIRSNEWVLPNDAHDHLAETLIESKFPLRTGQHFDHRPGMVNFSIVGRGATKEQREEYVKWDSLKYERVWIADRFNLRFPSLEAKVGGETGVDISPKGFDKSQMVKDFDQEDVLWFFGDAMHEEGNDYPLAQKVQFPKHVIDWRDTWNQLTILQQEGTAN